MNHCNICGNDGEGNFCGICGAPYDDQPSANESYTQNNSTPFSQQPNNNQGPPPPPQGYQHPPQGYQQPPLQMNQKNNKILPIVLGIVGGVLVLVIVAIIALFSLFAIIEDTVYYDDDYYYEDYYGDYYDDDYLYDDTSWFINNETGFYEEELSSGNYVVGIDIPVGVYDITIEKGVGEVYSTFDTAYEDYLQYEIWFDYENSSAVYQDVIEEVMLPEGTVLTISGLTISLDSYEAEIYTQEERSTTLQMEVSLQPGEYIAGVDFDEGTYNIVAVEGDGYVSSDSIYAEGYVYNYFSANSEFYINEYKNVYIEKGDNITTDLTIKLVPSK